MFSVIIKCYNERLKKKRIVLYFDSSGNCTKLQGFPGGTRGKESAVIAEDPLEEGMETHSSILAWRIPWTEEPGRLQSIESHRVGHN